MIYVCVLCLLPALTVGMKSLSPTGYVGGNITFHCSDWKGFVLKNKTSYVKYICNDPCTKDEHVIMKVKPGEIKHKDRISIYNNGGTLSVTFTDLQESDSHTYFCGLEVLTFDSLIRVNLNVRDVVTSGPQTTVRTVSVWSSSTVSSNSKDNTSHISTLFTTRQSTAAAALETHGGGNVRFVIIRTIVIITLVVLLLLITKIVIKKKTKVESLHNETQQDAEPEGVYETLQPTTEEQVYSSLTVTEQDSSQPSPHPVTLSLPESHLM